MLWPKNLGRLWYSPVNRAHYNRLGWAIHPVKVNWPFNIMGLFRDDCFFSFHTAEYIIFNTERLIFKRMKKHVIDNVEIGLLERIFQLVAVIAPFTKAKRLVLAKPSFLHARRNIMIILHTLKQLTLCSVLQILNLKWLCAAANALCTKLQFGCHIFRH